MNFTSPIEVEKTFYDAFSRQDLEVMTSVWAEDRPVFCIHPGGVLLTQRTDVIRSWRRIFEAQTPFHFELEYFHREVFADVAISHLSETLFLRNRMVGVVLVTNTYYQTPAGWRMVMHHASPEPDDEPSPEVEVFH